MILFLTSSPTGPLDNSRKVLGYDDKNQFIENLKKYWPKSARCLIISAFPDEDGANDQMHRFFEETTREILPVEVFDIWDARTKDTSLEALLSYNVIYLGGGHVPTQHAFFEYLGLKEKMSHFNGLVMGISAGSMNCAEIVYAQPELDGEAIDPDYEPFISGLGLTQINVLPHYQMVKDHYLDGMRLFEDITYGNSYGHRFIALVDGSYILCEDGRETIWGEAYLIADGEIEQICRENEQLIIDN